MTPLVDHPSMNVCKQADRRPTSRAQFDAVKGRLCYPTKAAIDTLGGIRRSKFPLVFAAVKIIVPTGLRKTIEATDRFFQRSLSIPSFAASSARLPACDTAVGTALPIGWLAKEYFFRYCASKIR